MRAITVRSVVFDRAVETAVVAERDDETSLRALSAEDVERITRDNECVAVDRIIAHYQAHPADDGHPAYQLQQIRSRALQKAKERGGDAAGP